MENRWYVLRSQAHKEGVLNEEIVSRKIDCFFPVVKYDPVNPRSRTWRPFFPNYLFVRTDLKQTGQSVFNHMPFSQGLVSFGGEPAWVPPALIEGLQKKLETLNREGSFRENGFKKGDHIRVVDGLFRGYEGLFDETIEGQQRVIVLLNMLNSRHRRKVEIDLRFVQTRP